jgi:hypothetical protein
MGLETSFRKQTLGKMVTDVTVDPKEIYCENER